LSGGYSFKDAWLHPGAETVRARFQENEPADTDNRDERDCSRQEPN
jgi:hypothetical protein